MSVISNINQITVNNKTTESTETIDYNSFCLFEDHIFITNKGWVKFTNNKLRRCLHSKCQRKHRIPNRPNKICDRETDCPDAGISCFLLHDNTKIIPSCYYSTNCNEVDCKLRHPSNRETKICELGSECQNALISCFLLHPLKLMIPVCPYFDDCKNYTCNFRHSDKRKQLCEKGSMCWDHIKNKSCNCIHPKISQKLCKWDEDNGPNSCKSLSCPFVHHPETNTA